MKATLTLVAFLYCLFAPAQSLVNEPNNQEYFPAGTSWREATTNLLDESYCRIDHCIIGSDTLINGVTYKKVYWNGDLGSYALREKDEKVFLYLYYLQKEIQAYDFGWEISKELYYQFAEEPYDYLLLGTLTNIKQIQLSDGLYYEYIDYGDDCKIIRGIGSEKGIFNTSFPQPTNGDQTHLLCFSRNDALIYKNPRFIDCESCERNETRIGGKEMDRPFRYADNKFYFSSEKYIDIAVTLYDADGKAFFSKNLKGGNSLDLNFLMNGVYFYQITLDNDAYTGNFIIKN